ncbi:hypothetical protein Q4575_16600 [Psychrosphaera sp. 1_MG-2023]|uniref:hypothetical protein n=1 Tax=Psychrosphaera sp. 1_MG-2023 TaxID=3062643 RepID=UPI0026E2DD10|nr:hypothetical protein [Psychrosphaera sp. 1_MG-2023]MDO6721036.1 hypothetical protein [Psychrosphaera sp. 1_MG-2023]
MALSNSQVTRLGDRLRGSSITNDDLALLDKFRQTFSEVDEKAYAIIQKVLENTSDWTATKRKRKTQQSIVDKLCRLPQLRLPQMQDIAGCRIVLKSGTKQASELNNFLITAFTQQDWQVEGKERDNDGYRAIHIIAKLGKQFYEIQLRTYAQDIWANLVETMSDEKNTLKYGGNEQEQTIMNKLKQLSESFVTIDSEAHNHSIEQYQQRIEAAIRHVLSD